MKKAFTLIEVILILAILSLVIFSGINVFRSFTYRSELNSQAQSIIEIIKQASSRTLASENAQSFGVHFETNLFVLFYPGPNYNPADPNNQVFNLKPNLTITNMNFSPSGIDVLFARVTGTPSRYGAFDVYHSKSVETRTIVIDASGQTGISPQGSLPPFGVRATDTRHIHFTYNQNVQNAVTLSLVFPDYPGDNQNISFQNYLDQQNNHFDWANTVTVNSQPQVLRIHTHSLIPTSAQFSITRDGRYNNVAMQVNLDGQNLINYSVLGVATQGSAAGVSAPEAQ